jgi:hypothetical protein
LLPQARRYGVGHGSIGGLQARDDDDSHGARISNGTPVCNGARRETRGDLSCADDDGARPR